MGDNSESGLGIELDFLVGEPIPPFCMRKGGTCLSAFNRAIRVSQQTGCEGDGDAMLLFLWIALKLYVEENMYQVEGGISCGNRG